MKTTFHLCILDEFGNPLVKKPFKATWTITEKDKEFLKDPQMLNILEEVIRDQLIIDLNRGILKEMIIEAVSK